MRFNFGEWVRETLGRPNSARSRGRQRQIEFYEHDIEQGSIYTDPCDKLVIEDFYSELIQIWHLFSEKEILVLRLYLQHHNQVEIAAMINLTEGRISQIMRSIIKKLKKECNV